MPELAARSSEITDRRMREFLPEMQARICEKMPAGVDSASTPEAPGSSGIDSHINAITLAHQRTKLAFAGACG